METFYDKNVLFTALTTMELRKYFRRLGAALPDFISSGEFFQVTKSHLAQFEMVATDDTIW